MRKRRRSNRARAAMALLSILLAGSVFGASSVYSFDYQGLDVKIRARASETYDTNITFLKENQKKDFITDLSAGVGVGYEGKRGNLNVNAEVTQQLFARYGKYNNTAERATANCNLELSKYDRISINDTFSHTYEPRSFEEAFVRTGGRYSYLKNDFRINYERDILKQFGVGAWYANSINIISLKELNNSFLNAAGVEAYYLPSSAATLKLAYDFTHRGFTDGESATKHGLSGALKYYLTEKLYFDAKAGLDIMNSYDNQIYLRPAVIASLMNDIDATSRAGVTFMKRYDMNAFMEDLFDEWQISGVFARQIFRRLGCAVSGFLGSGTYVEDDIKDNFWGVNGGLTYDLTKNIKARVDYSYLNRASGDDVLKYSKNRILAGLVAEF